MQLRLRTKLTLIMTGLVLLVVAVLSAVFVAQLFEQVLQETDRRTVEIANQVFEQARRAVAEAASRGMLAASALPSCSRRGRSAWRLKIRSARASGVSASWSATSIAPRCAKARALAH